MSQSASLPSGSVDNPLDVLALSSSELFAIAGFFEVLRNGKFRRSMNILVKLQHVVTPENHSYQTALLYCFQVLCELQFRHFISKGDKYLSQGEYHRAVKAYQVVKLDRLTSSSSSTVSLDSQLLYQFHTNLGLVLLLEEKKEDAVSAFRQALQYHVQEEEEERSCSRFNLLYALIISEKYREALQFIKEMKTTFHTNKPTIPAQEREEKQENTLSFYHLELCSAFCLAGLDRLLEAEIVLSTLPQDLPNDSSSKLRELVLQVIMNKRQYFRDLVASCSQLSPAHTKRQSSPRGDIKSPADKETAAGKTPPLHPTNKGSASMLPPVRKLVKDYIHWKNFFTSPNKTGKGAYIKLSEEAVVSGHSNDPLGSPSTSPPQHSSVSPLSAQKSPGAEELGARNIIPHFDVDTLHDIEQEGNGSEKDPEEVLKPPARVNKADSIAHVSHEVQVFGVTKSVERSSSQPRFESSSKPILSSPIMEMQSSVNDHSVVERSPLVSHAYAIPHTKGHPLSLGESGIANMSALPIDIALTAPSKQLSASSASHMSSTPERIIVNSSSGGSSSVTNSKFITAHSMTIGPRLFPVLGCVPKPRHHSYGMIQGRHNFQDPFCQLGVSLCLPIVNRSKREGGRSTLQDHDFNPSRSNNGVSSTQTNWQNGSKLADMLSSHIALFHSVEDSMNPILSRTTKLNSSIGNINIESQLGNGNEKENKRDDKTTEEIMRNLKIGENEMLESSRVSVEEKTSGLPSNIIEDNITKISIEGFTVKAESVSSVSEITSSISLRTTGNNDAMVSKKPVWKMKSEPSPKQPKPVNDNKLPSLSPTASPSVSLDPFVDNLLTPRSITQTTRTLVSSPSLTKPFDNPSTSQFVSPGGCQTTVFGGPVKCFPYDRLRVPGPYPDGVDIAHREQHLSDEEFITVLGVTKAAFAHMPIWKQIAKRKATGLF